MSEVRVDLASKFSFFAVVQTVDYVVGFGEKTVQTNFNYFDKKTSNHG